MEEKKLILTLKQLEDTSVLFKMCNIFEKRVKDVHQDMKVLVSKFYTEFAPVKGYSGWILYLHNCGKKECDCCPHAIEWAYYDWPFYSEKPRYLNGKGRRRKKLPSIFYGGKRKTGDPWLDKPRKKEVREKFKLYEQQMTMLNEESKKLMAKRRKIKLLLQKLPIRTPDYIGEVKVKRFNPNKSRNV